MVRDKIRMYTDRILSTLLKTRRQENLDESDRAFLLFGISLMDLLKYGNDTERYWHNMALRRSIQTSVFNRDDDATPAVVLAMSALDRMDSNLDLEQFTVVCTRVFRLIRHREVPAPGDLHTCIRFFEEFVPSREEEAQIAS